MDLSGARGGLHAAAALVLRCRFDVEKNKSGINFLSAMSHTPEVSQCFQIHFIQVVKLLFCLVQAMAQLNRHLG